MARWLFLLVLLTMLLLVIERFRGRWALNSWKSGMAARGEVFEIKQPPVSARALEFSNQFARLSAQWRDRQRLAGYAGQLTPVTGEEPGLYRRGSQELRPLPFNRGNSINTWNDLDEVLRQNEATLQSLCKLMKDPPTDVDYDVVESARENLFPNFVSVRHPAQILQAATINDLHKGDLTSAARDLEALLSFSKLHEEDPTLFAYMIRIAIIGLTVDVFWDALQADGWTEPQLAAIQQSCADSSRLLSQMPRMLEAERALRIDQMEWFRSHSYQSWVARYEKLYQGFGVQPLAEDVAFSRKLFHPLWSFAWADREELEFLQHVQRDVVVLRESVRQRSLVELKKQIASNHDGYRAPAAAWRFYGRLPVLDTFFEVSSKPVKAFKDDEVYPYPYFPRAWQTTMENLTLHEMMVTAIALKRYELQHGKVPADLGALVPDYLAASPTDFMDGKPLRYRLASDGAFTLYSIGRDLQDDGGNAEPPPDTGGNTSPWPWNRKDWVWPRAATVRAPQISGVDLRAE